MKKYTLIGASGFLGTRLIDVIGKGNCINIDKNQSTKYPDITIIQDIRNEGIINSIPPSTEVVILLAAEHKDDVNPISLYYDVNVKGTQNVLEAMDSNGITNLIFTSSVAVYGLNKKKPDEHHPADPFNHYGTSKWQAEELLRKWYFNDPNNRSLTIVRPAVIFGEGNRGNVYNLINQISSDRFIMVGKGKNIKSMAYVGNVASFLHHCIKVNRSTYRLFNYSDKPDLNMNDLIKFVLEYFGKKQNLVRLPYMLALGGAKSLELLAKLRNENFPVNTIRIKKFCADTQFDATAAFNSGFSAPFSLLEGLKKTLEYEFPCSKRT